jgi:2-dehydro-3-deoxy-D-gluconate 5-dehydrogenase
VFHLTGKVAIVTGGNGGIGLGIARGLARAGAAVAIVGRNPTKSARAASELQALGAHAAAIEADLLDAAQVDAMVNSAVDRFDGVDILVANAGTNRRRRPEEVSPAQWHEIVETNLTAVFTCCQAVYPIMRRRGGGKIVTIGSMTSIFGFGLGAPYAASKGGVVQLTKSLACAWARDNIQLNCILPGFIETELTQQARRDVEGLERRVIERTPAGRWGRPDDVAGAAVFFSSPASDFVTGTALAVDGGFSSFMA